MSSQQPRTVSRDHLDSGVHFEEPVGELEREIAEIFAEAFGIDRVGANDDFFDLGGDSLMAQSIALSIAKQTGREFRISSLVDHGTPRKIAELLGEAPHARSTPTERPPIFMVHGLRGFMLPRPAFLGGLAPGQKLRMFELPGIHGEAEPREWIEDIAAEYVRQLEAECPSGPVLLGGYCGGCIITLEMAAQLAEKGRPVLQMVLFDPGGVPRNVLDHFRRNLAQANGSTHPSSWREQGWLTSQWKHLRHFFLLGRWTDGSRDEDFADKRLRSIRERRLKFRMWRDRVRGKKEHDAALNLSTTAQAKLFAAYQHYRPRPFNGPVTVFCSQELHRQFEGDKAIWVHLLPRREVHVLGETHREVIQAEAATGARLMQAVFNAALSAR